MSLPSKLQLKAGTRLAVVGLPAGMVLGLPPDVQTAPDARTAEAVLAFALDSDAVDGVAGPAFAAARADRLAWIAYPKGGQLGTDLNRDRLARLAQERGAQPVRQVALDATWSALRFRPRS